MSNEPAGQGNKNYPMRVVLLEGNHIMRSVWLPAEKEGFYVFAPDENGETIPLSIVAENGEWYANLSRNGQFILQGEYCGKKVVLKNKFSIIVVIGERRFNLYSEVEYENDNVFLPYYIEPHSDITIGRLETCDIFYPNALVSREHAFLHFENNLWFIVDANSKNGVFVNGRNVKQARLHVGDIIYIMGLFIIMGVGFISINNANGRVKLTSQKVRLIANDDPDYKPYENSRKPEPPLFDRLPRKKFKVSPKEIEIEMPPMPMGANKIPLLLRMGNPILSGGRAIVTGNPFSAVSSLLMPLVTQGFTEKDRKEYEHARETKYREYLQYKSQEISQEISDEQRVLSDVYPPLSEMLNFSKDKTRLWERRKFDDDFLSLRIGCGSVPMIATKKFQPKKFELERDYLVDEMYNLAEAPAVLENAPVMISLLEDYVTSVVGSHQQKLQIINNLIIQISLTHAYDEVKIVLLADPDDAKVLDFARYLPHNWSDDRSTRFFATSISDAQQLSKHLNTAWEKLFGDKSYNSSKQLAPKDGPAYVVIALSKTLYERVEILKNVTQTEKYSGVSLITAFDSSPKECTKLISLFDNPNVIDLIHPEIADQCFVPDTVDPHAADESLRNVIGTRLKLSAGKQYSLPNMVTFLEMYGVGRVEHLNPLKRWADNNPVKSLAAPLGVGTDGKHFMLDLHEKKQGPHGLIAGGTGSGKSEFIITYILSMAVNYSPDEVAFILIDYKGGGLADAFVDPKRGIHLPHVVGTITNLDGAAIQRSLMSINSELKRRQAVFKKAKSETNEGTMDIYDYQKLYRNKRVSEPMPHLFIISDEFAELKKQEPEFMDELISTARIGRSLGVHLILATQKPTGVVNDQIWSNTKFRVCLRVAEKSDSMEMLKRPEAAEIKNTGRFYLQVGYNELFAMGQSAWCGAGYIPQDEVVVEEDNTVQFIDNMGQISHTAKPKQTDSDRKPEGKQIVSIVKYLSDLSKRENIVPRSLWCEPLPAKLEYAELAAKHQFNAGKIEALMGMVDEPATQSQFPYVIDMNTFHHMLIVGGSGSGKSSFVRTLLTSLISRYSPDVINYYILDMSGGSLSAFSKMPHCGAYLTESAEADFDRLLSLLKSMIAERKEIFAKADVTSYEAYREVGTMPMALVILDNYPNINNFSKGSDLFMNFNDYLKEASAYGIRFILTASHFNEVHSRTRQECDLRIALQQKDKYGYTDILDTKCSFTVPACSGRGVAVVNEKPLEFHTAVLDVNLNEQDRVLKLKQLISVLAKKYPSRSLVKELTMASNTEEYADFSAKFAAGRIPLGYSLRDMKPVALPLRQLQNLSLYFGNPTGVKYVFSNIIYAARRSNAAFVIVKRLSDSIFDLPAVASVFEGYGGNVSYLYSTFEGLTALNERIMGEVTARNVLRDEYCTQNGIPSTDRSRINKASKYICANSQPLFVVFESLGDVCSLEKTPEQRDIEETLQVYFEKCKGYNIYFTAGFYPEDESVCYSSDTVKAFTKPQLCLLFGGRFDKQNIINPVPSDVRRCDKREPAYDRFFMKYRDEIYPMRMPCGELHEDVVDLDDAPIV